MTRWTSKNLNRIITSLLVLIVLAAAAVLFPRSGDSEQAAGIQTGIRVERENTRSDDPGARTRVHTTIAVLPFASNSAGRENIRYLAGGVHESLLTGLSKIDGLEVISRTSLMNYQGSARPVRQIGADLGATHLLEGVVQQGANRVRIDVELIDVNTDEILWSESFDGEASTETIYASQEAITHAVALALQVLPAPGFKEAAGRAPTDNPDAYRALLMARQLELQGGPERAGTAAEFARQAIELDPAYVEAHLALARIQTQAVAAGLLAVEEAAPRITTAINTAMKLRPGDGPAYAALARYQEISGQAGSNQSFETALNLDPGNPDTLFAFARSLLRQGKPEPALPMLQRVADRDPLSLQAHLALGNNYLALEEYDRARSAFSRINEIDPSNALGYGAMGGSYLQQGQLDQALYFMGRALLFDPRDYELGGWILFLNDCLEDYAAAGEWSGWLDGRITNQPLPMAMQARHHYLNGNFETALQLSNLALNLGLPDRAGSDAVFMRIKRDEALAMGAPASGIQVFQSRHPGLLDPIPQIEPGNAMQAVDLAQLMMLAKRQAEATALLRAVIEFYDQPWAASGIDRIWLVPVKAEALAVLGDQSAALAELRRIADHGWKLDWRWETVLNFNFNGIQETPEFRAIINALAERVTEQRFRSQEMADGLEILPPPSGGRD